MEAFIGQIFPVAFNWAPRGWYRCEGQILPISQYTALFALIGTTYGGNGQTTFALPDLRGRVPIASGAGPGLANHANGDRGGAETVALQFRELPAHTHSVKAGQLEPDADVCAQQGIPLQSGQMTATGAAAASTSSAAGNGGAHPNTPPYLAVNWIICVQGIFPSRS